MKPENNRLIKTVAPNFHRDTITTQELTNAKTIAIKTMQREAFANELAILNNGNTVNHGSNRKYNLFLDPQGIIRCKHRLDNLPGNEMYPILAHGKHPFIIGYITWKHIHANCSSRQYTLQKSERP